MATCCSRALQLCALLYIIGALVLSNSVGSQASATTVYVSINGTDGSACGAQLNSTCATVCGGLQALLQDNVEEWATLSIGAGEYSTSCGDVTFPAGVSIVIEGANTTAGSQVVLVANASSSDPPFNLTLQGDSDEVVISNIVFDGLGHARGARIVAGRVTMEAVGVHNTVSNAITIEAEAVTLNSCDFSNGTSITNGGALSVESVKLNITSSSFHGSGAPVGGCLWADASELYMDAVAFRNCSCNTRGCAASLQSQAAVLKNLLLFKIAGHGGAYDLELEGLLVNANVSVDMDTLGVFTCTNLASMFVVDGNAPHVRVSNLHVEDCFSRGLTLLAQNASVINAHLQTMGTGLLAEVEHSLDIASSTFSCESTAIVHHGRFIQLEGSMFANNAAGSIPIGASVLLTDAERVHVRACNFSNNTGGSSGPVIRAARAIWVDVVESTFTSNTAESDIDSVVLWSVGSALLDGVVLKQNSGKALVRCVHVGGDLVIQDSSFEHNFCSAVGVVGFAVVNSSHFEGNGGALHGGALDAEGGALIRYTQFIGNRADHGGAVYLGGQSQVLNSSFIANVAVQDGGGIHVGNNGDAEMNGVFVSKNIAGFVGGGFYLAGEHKQLRITDAVVRENTAENGHAAYIGVGAKMFVDNSLFDKNKTPAGSTFAVQCQSANGGQEAFLEATDTLFDESSVSVDDCLGNLHPVCSNPMFRSCDESSSEEEDTLRSMSSERGLSTCSQCISGVCEQSSTQRSSPCTCLVPDPDCEYSEPYIASSSSDSFPHILWLMIGLPIAVVMLLCVTTGSFIAVWYWNRRRPSYSSIN